MKNLFFLSVALLLNSECFAQNNNTLFLTYALSNPEPVFNGNVAGGAGYKPVASNSFGLRYLIKSPKIITLETGIEYSNYHFKLDYVDDPGISIPDNKQTINLVSIPLYAHLTFLKYLFINGGLLIDCEVSRKQSSINKQSGVGLGLGAGIKYKFKNVAIFVNPFLERHAFLRPENMQLLSGRSTINPGGRVGVGFSF